MRRLTSIEQEKELIDFVSKAAKVFETNPNLVSYSSEEVKEGELLALRWGLGNDCVMVIKLDDSFSPVIYQNEIRGTTNE